MISRIKSLFADIRTKYHAHQQDYHKYYIRDFTDVLIFAKDDSLQNEKQSACYLTDENLTKILSDLFTGLKVSF